MLLGNYNGTPSHPVTILDGIRNVAGPNIEVVYEPGCPLALSQGRPNKPDAADDGRRRCRGADRRTWSFMSAASAPQLEGEEMKRELRRFQRRRPDADRTAVACRSDLLKALQATGKPVVFVNCSGSAIAMPWAANNLPAILQAWYPGEAGRTGRGRSSLRRRESRRAVAGHVLPFHERSAGRLTITPCPTAPTVISPAGRCSPSATA